MLGLLVLLCLSQAAFADNGLTNTSSIVASGQYENDISISILKTLFGGLPIFGAERDALQNIFRIFNMCVLVVGGILASYTWGMALMATAQQGQFMGKLSGTMTPIRTVFGVAAILPIANGYALIQVIIMWLIVQGVMIANVVWSTFASSDTLADSLSIATVQPESTTLARSVLIASTCMAAIQKQADIDGDDVKMGWSYGYGSSKRPLSKDLLAQLVAQDPEKNITLNAGNLTGSNGIADNACGTITIKGFAVDKNGLFDGTNKALMAGEAANATTGVIMGNNSKSLAGKVTGYGTALYSTFRIVVDYSNDRKEWKAWVNEMAKEHANATENLLFKTNIIANAIVNDIENKNAQANREAWSQPIKSQQPETPQGTKTGSNEDLGQTMKLDEEQVPAGVNLDIQEQTMSREQIIKDIDALGTDYQLYLRSKAARSYQNGKLYNDLVRNSNKYGWMLAGSFYVQMGGVTDSVNQIALNVPVATYVPYSPETLKNKYVNSRYLSALNEYFGESKTYGGDDSFRINSVNRADDKEVAADTKFIDSGFNLSVLTEALLKNGINMAISDQEHPVMQLKRLGTIMLSLSGTLITIMTATMGKVDNSALFFVSMFGYTMVAVLITSGITLSYILPMMPVLIWLGMCFGWLVMVMQAMIASPLWVVMHLSPHTGDDFIGGQRNGYQLVFTLVIRPVLMVFGFIASVLALTVTGFFINNLFVFIYQMSQVGRNGFITALFGVFVVPLMYSTIVYIAFKEMLGIMHKVPDELLSWFGGNGQSLGGYAQNMSHGSVQAFGGINAQIGRPFDGLRHNLGEHANMLKTGEEANKSRLQDKYKNIHDKLVGGDSAIPIGGNDDGFASTGYINDGDIGVSSDGINGWEKMIHNGVLSDNEADLERARHELYKDVPQAYMDKAMNSASKSINDRYQHNKSNGNEEPISNKDFVNEVNKNLANDLFGASADDMRHLEEIASARTNGAKANNLMRNTFKKVAAISARTGQDYDVVAKDVAHNISNSMRSFAEDKGVDYNALTSDSISKQGNAEQEHNYKIAGSMLNAWNKSVNREGRNPENDVLEYEIGRGFGYSDRNYGNLYDDGSWAHKE